jgi:transcriptional regulator with XRE-family HTH domain
MTFGQVVRYLRQSQGLSQVSLAADLKISPSYLSQLENDKREPTIPLARLMAKRLGVPAQLLFASALADEADQDSDVARAIAGFVEALGIAARQQQIDFPPEDS